LIKKLEELTGNTESNLNLFGEFRAGKAQGFSEVNQDYCNI
jgi:hypothetical protein